MPYTTLSYANGKGYYFHTLTAESGHNVTRRNLSQIPTNELEGFEFVQVKLLTELHVNYDTYGKLNAILHLLPFLQASTAFRKSATHGGDDIATFAQGPMSHLFHKVHLSLIHI